MEGLQIERQIPAPTLTWEEIMKIYKKKKDNQIKIWLPSRNQESAYLN